MLHKQTTDYNLKTKHYLKAHFTQFFKKIAYSDILTLQNVASDVFYRIQCIENLKKKNNLFDEEHKKNTVKRI